MSRVVLGVLTVLILVSTACYSPKSGMLITRSFEGQSQPLEEETESTPTPEPTPEPTPLPSIPELIADRYADGVVLVVNVAVVGHGTGFIFETKGTTALIMTAAHVVDGGDGYLAVTVGDGDDLTPYIPTVVEKHTLYDLAILSICCGEFTKLHWHKGWFLSEDENTPVITLSRMLDEESVVVELGWVVESVSILFGGTYFVSDVNAGPGYSGSPMLDMNGKVWGVIRGEPQSHPGHVGGYFYDAFDQWVNQVAYKVEETNPEGEESN